MTTVITHFFNEERLLRWWLPHHRAIFRNGILINHGSTDRSVEVCRALAPDWRVVPSRLTHFDAVETDREVMELEAETPGWKMALNTTEFFVASDLERKLEAAAAKGVSSMQTTGVFMIDGDPGVEPNAEAPLVTQKFFGFVENGWRAWYPTLQSWNWDFGMFLKRRGWRQRWRHRLLHRHPHGDYLAGRHQTRHSVDERRNDLFTLWYCYSPWRPWFINRKVAIGPRVPESDRAKGHGTGHLRDESQLERDFQFFRRMAYDLNRNSKLASAAREVTARTRPESDRGPVDHVPRYRV
jgi:hypothetical protein